MKLKLISLLVGWIIGAIVTFHLQIKREKSLWSAFDMNSLMIQQSFRSEIMTNLMVCPFFWPVILGWYGFEFLAKRIAKFYVN